MYQKETSPTVADFTPITLGDPLGFAMEEYELIWEVEGRSNDLGELDPSDEEIVSHPDFYWENNMLSEDLKTFHGGLAFNKKLESAEAAQVMRSNIELGIAATLQGVYTEIAATESQAVAQMDLEDPEGAASSKA